MISTTTITTWRPSPGAQSGMSDPWDAVEVVATEPGTVVLSAQPGSIVSTKAAAVRDGGVRVETEWRVILPAGADLAASDRLRDDSTGLYYRVGAVWTRSGVGVTDHVAGDLTRVVGAVG